MRAVSLHRDVLVITSALLQVNCVIVRGGSGEGGDGERGRGVSAQMPDEAFVIDSPVLPDELDALPALLEQAQFPPPSGLLATHGDWDHLLGRLAFPEVALGCAESTVERLRAAPGEAQRELRAFDEELMIVRPRPLALGSVQALPVPGRCDIGDRELELHPSGGHSPDGMAIAIPWARVLVVGDYLSTAELPTLSAGGELNAYVSTLEYMQGLIADAARVVPGHGPMLDQDLALGTLEEDLAYLKSLREHEADAELPPGRRAASHRRTHVQNAAHLSRPHLK